MTNTKDEITVSKCIKTIRDSANGAADRNRKPEPYFVQEKFIFQILDRLLRIELYSAFMERVSFWVTDLNGLNAEEMGFDEFAAREKDSNSFSCDDLIRTLQDLDVSEEIKGCFKILGTDGIFRYSLHRLSKDFNALPDFKDFDNE